ncbi:hypothetical protein M5689_020444 [Euphorbia peplus]|nr:hypothetical protein M5689_020444 [Euphorbia peplus]
MGFNRCHASSNERSFQMFKRIDSHKSERMVPFLRHSDQGGQKYFTHDAVIHGVQINQTHESGIMLIGILHSFLLEEPRCLPFGREFCVHDSSGKWSSARGY